MNELELKNNKEEKKNIFFSTLFFSLSLSLNRFSCIVYYFFPLTPSLTLNILILVKIFFHLMTSTVNFIIQISLF